VRLAIADDSALFRDGLRLLLEGAGLEVVLAAGTAAELIVRLPTDPLPDAVVLDIRMPPTFTDEGLIAAEELKRRHPGLGVLVLSAYDETVYAARLLALGPHGVGYLLKDRVGDIAALRDALERVTAGGQVIDADIVTRLLLRRQRGSELDALTPRERDVLRHMAEGRSNAGIGQKMSLAPKTIESHVASVFAKLRLPQSGDDNRRVRAVLAWLRVHPHDAEPAPTP
jgi:DNA-binding NarL/FixJ family response regulator